MSVYKRFPFVFIFPGFAQVPQNGVGVKSAPRVDPRRINIARPRFPDKVCALTTACRGGGGDGGSSPSPRRPASRRGVAGRREKG